ncbi:hypothetical protein [Geomesophilobacter sediminis]|uniref:Lipoprotein n=1 Tax=Geomesophilobacter sediminis TaxID=2798584 RepID=A0A8J7M0Y2_9BACT|nr:hypothetical protein [Geomesophilobacter sediminis]MBJ6726556.1 hypothetical protein [Geomesophilobacter sediminis]
MAWYEDWTLISTRFETEVIMRNVSRMITLPAALVIISSLCGCSAEHVKQGIYEGIKTRNELQSSPQERIGKPEQPSYSDYKRQREEQPR